MFKFNLTKLWRAYRTYRAFVRECNHRQRLYLAGIHASYEAIDRAERRVDETYTMWQEARK
jgi:hypothetical protein